MKLIVLSLPQMIFVGDFLQLPPVKKTKEDKGRIEEWKEELQELRELRENKISSSDGDGGSDDQGPSSFGAGQEAEGRGAGEAGPSTRPFHKKQGGLHVRSQGAAEGGSRKWSDRQRGGDGTEGGSRRTRPRTGGGTGAGSERGSGGAGASGVVGNIIPMAVTGQALGGGETAADGPGTSAATSLTSVLEAAPQSITPPPALLDTQMNLLARSSGMADSPGPVGPASPAGALTHSVPGPDDREAQRSSDAAGATPIPSSADHSPLLPSEWKDAVDLYPEIKPSGTPFSSRRSWKEAKIVPIEL